MKVLTHCKDIIETVFPHKRGETNSFSQIYSYLIVDTSLPTHMTYMNVYVCHLYVNKKKCTDIVTYITLKTMKRQLKF